MMRTCPPMNICTATMHRAGAHHILYDVHVSPKEHLHTVRAPHRWIAIFSEWSGDMRTKDDVNKRMKGKGNPTEGDDPPFKFLGPFTVTAAKVEDSMTSFGKPGYSLVHNTETFLVFYAKDVGKGPVLSGNPADKDLRPADWTKLCGMGAVVQTLKMAKKMRVSALEAAKQKKVRERTLY